MSLEERTHLCVTRTRMVEYHTMDARRLADFAEHLVEWAISAPISITPALRLTCPLTTTFRSTRHTTFSFHTKPISAINGPWTLEQVFVGSAIQEHCAACFRFRRSAEWVVGSSHHGCSMIWRQAWGWILRKSKVTSIASVTSESSSSAGQMQVKRPSCSVFATQQSSRKSSIPKAKRSSTPSCHIICPFESLMHGISQIDPAIVQGSLEVS